jgi:hypothetical protein
MAIYDFSKAEKEELSPSPSEPEMVECPQPHPKKRDRFFSSLAARLFFLLLLMGNLLWTCYALFRLLFCMTGRLATGDKMSVFKTKGEKAWISLRRSLVCGVSLFIALFSPALGIMIACTYFLMYDKSGIEEVVPTSLQSQFKDFIPKE